MKKRNFSIDKIKSLFILENGKYQCKQDEAFVEAFKVLLGGKNKNDIPFTKSDIRKQPTLNQFNFEGKSDFTRVCQLLAKPIKILNDSEWENEKIEALFNFDQKSVNNSDLFFNSMGVAYIITCELDRKEHIIKFGQTRTPFSLRLQSYNCGVINSFRTASTTNIKILQSFVACAVPFNLYLYYPEAPKKYIWRGIESVDFASPFSLAVEDILLQEFKTQFGFKPLANIQSNATGKSNT